MSTENLCYCQNTKAEARVCNTCKLAKKSNSRYTIAMHQALTLKEIKVRLNQPQHVLIHLCEKGVIVPEVETAGRGLWRRFSTKSLFEFAVALELRKYEIPVAVIRVVIHILSAFAKTVSRTVKDFALPDSLAHSGPELELYLYGGQYAAFVLDNRSIIGFDLQKMLCGAAKQATVEKLKKLPSNFESYLYMNLSDVVRRVI